MSDAYFIQIWVRCEHEGCGAMVDLLVKLEDAIYHRAFDIPPGWSHRRVIDDNDGPICYMATALCPVHGDPCIHTLEQQSNPSDAEVKS